MVTLNLTDIQAVMLDALFRNHSTEENIDLVKKEFKEFLKNDAHDPSTYAYAIVANTPDWIYQNDDPIGYTKMMTASFIFPLRILYTTSDSLIKTRQWKY